eukprot:COSAG02_NODE_5532_length_4250_cov_108.522525_6_plen_50_part_00
MLVEKCSGNNSGLDWKLLISRRTGRIRNENADGQLEATSEHFCIALDSA